MIKKLIALLLFQLIVFSSQASHIVGGEIYYDYLGSNNYRFYIAFYRDCYSTGAAFDSPLHLTIYNASGQQVDNLNVPFPGSVNVPVAFSNPCVTPPTNICVEKAIYTITVNLPPIVGGYTVSYQRCCRGPNVTNLVNPSDAGLTWTTHVPGSETGAYINSSPRYTNYPPLALCNNDDLIFDHSATDPDGDSLVYSLVTPYTGGTAPQPAPNPASAPPYYNVTWANGFSAANPLGPGATISIDPQTGLLTASPQLLGLFCVGIRVSEYRNGVLIGSTTRDFLFKVINCNITMQAILPTQEQLSTFVSYCQGYTVQFENNSYGGTHYYWDFGDPTTTTDVSTTFAPSYTYPSDGIYTVMLVVNPGWTCTDTAYMTVNVNNEFTVDFSAVDSVCALGGIDFTATSNYASSTFSWDFGANATPATASTQTVTDVLFSSSGNQPVIVTATNNYCTASDTEIVYIYPIPDLNVSMSPTYQCEGLVQHFNNTSTGTSYYHWDFGVASVSSDTSNLMTPDYTYTLPGTYTVTLIAGSTGICFDTITETITVYEPMSVSFTHNDSMCVTNNNYDFYGQISGPSIMQWNWSFGAYASIASSADTNVLDVVYSQAGVFPVSLNAWFNNCTATYTDQVTIFKEPTIDFILEDGTHCVPANLQFTNLSSADSPALYTWTFSDDGSTNQDFSPTHLYTTAGQYMVNLEMITTEGCIDTLYKELDSITIYPKPVSLFDVDPKQTDICHAAITFVDLSEGAVSFLYELDDNGAISTKQNFVYDYQTSGWHHINQIVTSEYGCKDTSFQEIYIEPFVIYAPNAFTPDGNEFNNVFNASFALTVEEWELKIYNRFGELLFVSHDPAFGWDGTYGGKIMQDDVYVYIINYKSCEKPTETQQITGHVSLLR